VRERDVEVDERIEDVDAEKDRLREARRAGGQQQPGKQTGQHQRTSLEHLDQQMRRRGAD
jgi:hypothetical protein